MSFQLHHGDCLNIMPMIDRDSIDAIVTDPPYGLDFMGKDWDHGVPGEHFWREAYRVAKPGAHLLAFGGTRTFHRLAVAIEDAGWEIRDCVMWVYGQGFPKSHDVSKAIDREAGAEREVIGRYSRPDGTDRDYTDWKINSGEWKDNSGFDPSRRDITAPATPAAAEWDGWGTALKPAWEPIIVARKPLAGTVAENVQRYGTGAINVDACRIETGESTLRPLGSTAYQRRNHGILAEVTNKQLENEIGGSTQGRWPANLIHDGSAEVLAGFPDRVAGGSRANTQRGQIFVHGGEHESYGDTGSAARFFYCAKASKQDRDEGLEDFEIKQRQGTRVNSADDTGKFPDHDLRDNTRNFHPTVKPTSLMRYLCRLITPPNGVILDPFMGSGSTGKAAILEGFNFIGVELEREYLEIAARRIEHACGKVGIVIDQPLLIEARREMAEKPRQMILL